jgi:hypothetical protein
MKGKQWIDYDENEYDVVMFLHPGSAASHAVQSCDCIHTY